MFYAADNAYGSSTSVGFSNTWRVSAFIDRASRDAFVVSGDRSTKAIKRAEIGRYLDNVVPFSGKAVCVDPYATENLDAPGLVGRVCVTYPGSHHGVTKLRS